MPKRTLEVVIFAAAAALASSDNSRGGSSRRKLIGEVISEMKLRGSQGERHLNNEDILKEMLGKEHFSFERDECLSISGDGTETYGRCDIRQFPYCSGDRPNICFNRVNRQDKFYPDKHPYYYIDYNRVHCYPDRINNVDFTCSSCSPGRWCMPEGRCILDENKYHCWAAEE